MTHWECPNCTKQRHYVQEFIMKVCNCCQVEMEVVE